MASPDPEPNRIEHIAALVDKHAPVGSTVASAVASGPHAVHPETGANRFQLGNALAPTNPAGSLSMPGAGVEIDLPAEADIAAPQRATNGLAVYRATHRQSADVVVAAANDSMSVQVVIPSREAPLVYRFAVRGARLAQQPDGSISLVGEDGAVVAKVARPWAEDAAGQPVATSLHVDGSTLVQRVSPTSATQYPIVADPDFFFYLKCAGAVAYFLAENAWIAAKFWRVFKSARAFARIMKELRGMSRRAKIRYVKSKLGSLAGQATGWNDLVIRCTP